MLIRRGDRIAPAEDAGSGINRRGFGRVATRYDKLAVKLRPAPALAALVAFWHD